LSQKFTPAR